MARHRLTDKDLGAMTATCAVCGPDTKISTNGKASHVCMEARRISQRKWIERHPAQAQERKLRPPSKHRLEKRDGSRDRCAVCGPVSPVVIGRGYGCPNRAKELGRKTFEEKPQPACPICRTYLDRFGACAKCDNEANVDDIYIPKESRRYAGAGLVGDLLSNGFSIVEHDAPLPDTESVVPGWKTLGSLDPVGSRPTVRPEYAKLYGSGRK